MPDKLEVLPGQGLVARFGDIAVWAGPQATPALQSHLVSEAQRLAREAGAGDQLANSFISVLQRGDPEPNSPFAVLGPGANGLTLFLHGPVQAWDSGRWVAPQPVPGWLVTPIGRPWPLIVLPYGASPPLPSQPGNPLDLVTGAVAGGGFVLLRPTAGTPGQAGQVGRDQAASPRGQAPNAHDLGTNAQGPQATPAPGFSAPGGPLPGAHGAGFGGPTTGPAPAGPAPAGPAPASTAPAGPGTGQAPFGQGPGQVAPSTFPNPRSASSPQAPPGGTGPTPRPQFQFGNPTAAPAGNLADLRSIAGTAGPGRALPLATTLSEPEGPDVPDVPGNRCDKGHFNHPRATACARCGHPLSAQATTRGKRPPLGVLLADDGSVWCLDRSCVIGSAAASAPEVLSGGSQPIVMRAGPNHNMAPVHAEIQLREWSVYLVDRGAEGGSCIQAPASSEWSVLNRNEQRELANGSHISCGGRVLTFLSAWPV